MELHEPRMQEYLGGPGIVDRRSVTSLRHIHTYDIAKEAVHARISWVFLTSSLGRRIRLRRARVTIDDLSSGTLASEAEDQQYYV